MKRFKRTTRIIEKALEQKEQTIQVEPNINSKESLPILKQNALEKQNQTIRVEENATREQFTIQPSTSYMFKSNECDALYTKSRYDSDFDFDSDDSTRDKTCEPPCKTKIIESFSDSDSFIENSQPIPSINIPETPEKCVNEDSGRQEEETRNIAAVNNENEPEALVLTKKGNFRKRKCYDTSLEERKKNKKDEKILIKYNLKPGCDQMICKKKCASKISDQRREDIHKLYWSLSWKEQKIFLINNTSCTKPSKIRNFSGTEKKNRTKTINYFLKDDVGENVSVCRVFFLTTLGYCKSNDKPVRNAIKNKDNVPLDGRGYNENPTKIDNQPIKSHIESYRPTISHYRREHAPNRRYLSSETTIQSMYDDFILKHPNIAISYDYYRKTLKTMNISFAKLGHEECEICESYEIHNPKFEELRHRNCNSCVNFEKHHQRYKLAREQYNADRISEKSDVAFFSADLQKVIMLPRIDVFKAVLFCPRLIAFNESFVPVGHKTSEMSYAAIWHEAISGRKKEDIACAFRSFLKYYRDVKNIVLWLDNCSAQNKNWALFSFLIYFINSNETSSDTIVLKYFEAGHTFMSADEFHHQVEHALKKKKKIYDFEDFAEAVASTNNRKTVVKKMEVGDFLKITDDTSNAKIQQSNPRAYLRDMSEIRFQRGKKSMFYKCSFSDPEYIELECLKKKVMNTGTAPIPKTEARGITNDRKNNILQKLGPLMPSNRKIFWENLHVNNSAKDLNIILDD